MNPFQILGIAPTEDKMKIRRAYVREAKLHHPDAGGDPEHFHKIRTAYEGLVNNKFPMRELHVDVHLDLDAFMVGGLAEAEVYTGYGAPEIIQFEVPALTYPDTVLSFYNKDSTHNKICVTLKEKRESDYIRLEDRIVIRRTINMFDALHGAALDIVNFDGRCHTVEIAPNTKADKLMYYFEGEGFFHKSTKQRGDLTVVVTIDKKR